MPFYKKNNTNLSRSKRIEKRVEKNGLRSLIYNTVGDKYKGEWKEDKKSGKGTLMTRNQELYEGDFSRNYRHGFGVLAFRIPGTKVYSLAYRGTWRNGWPEGNGLRIYKDGSYYLGEWKYGKRHGHGQMWYSNKSWYHGEWVNDSKQGLGVFVQADGNRYEGAWYMNKKHGEGRFFFLATGQIQDGVWKDDYCVFSVMCDIPYRQSAIRPSVYPIPVFRRSVSDILQPHHDDRFLLRWLRARNWDPEAAEKMLRQSMKWRHQWEVDSGLKEWTPPEVLLLYHPSGTSGCDKDGAPVIVVPFAGFDVVGLIHSATRQDLIRMTIKVLEENMTLAVKSGENQVVVVFDMEGFNLRQYAWRPAAELVISLIQMYEANYPEILKACYIINAPRVFAIAFNVVKKFLNEYTLGKIQIFKSDPRKWKPAVLSNITPENLPQHYGGTLADPDGNPRYTTKVKLGGKVPKSFYTKKLEVPENGPKKEYTTAVVKKSEKLTLDFIVAEEGCFLRWDFRTEGHDIRFGVTLKDEQGEESPVVRHRRVAAHQIDESGVVACQAPATYTVIFDNSYSLLRSKKIHYCVYVTLPLNKLNILPTDEDLQDSNENSEQNEANVNEASCDTSL